MPNEQSLASKLARVQAQCSRIEMETAKIINKKDASKSYSYDFIGESAMFDFVRPLLAAENIATIPQAKILSLTDHSASVEVSLVLVSEGERELASMVGFATDAYGDKFVAMAITSATRYLFWKLFRFPSSDPQADDARNSGERITPAERTAASDAESEKLTEELLTLAKAHGYEPAVRARMQEYTGHTGLVLPDAKYLKGEIAMIRGAIGAASSGTPVSPSAGTDTPASTSASPDPSNGQSAPQTDAQTLEAILAGQTAQVGGIDDAQNMRIVELANKLVALNPEKGDLAQRVMNIDKVAQQTYKAGLAGLTHTQAQQLIETIEVSVLRLEENKQ